MVIARLGDNQDAELALMLLHTLEDVGACSLRGVIANAHLSRERADFARGTLDALQLDHAQARAQATCLQVY